MDPAQFGPTWQEILSRCRPSVKTLDPIKAEAFTVKEPVPAKVIDGFHTTPSISICLVAALEPFEYTSEIDVEPTGVLNAYSTYFPAEVQPVVCSVSSEPMVARSVTEMRVEAATGVANTE